MRFGSEEARGLLTGSFDHYWSADLYYNGARVLAGVTITLPRLNESGNAKVQQSGSCTVVWTDEFATSLSPRDVADPLAPFGAVLHVYSNLYAGLVVERVEFGRFLITDVPEARDERMRWHGEWLTVGSTVSLELFELLESVNQETFDVPTVPTSLGSAWSEIGFVTGLPITRTVSDQSIPRSVLYQNNKLDTAVELFDVVLDALPHMTADGTLGARPKQWGPPVDTIPLDSIVSVRRGMSAEQVYNRVVVRATGGDGNSVLAVAEITDGPLRVRNADGSRSPFGARTKYLSSELVTDHYQARRWADSELERVSRIRTSVARIVETFNPLRERGDVVLIERVDEWWRCRVVDISRSARATQELSVEVAESIEKVYGEMPPYTPTTGGPLLPGESTFPGDDVFPGG